MTAGPIEPIGAAVSTSPPLPHDGSAPADLSTGQIAGTSALTQRGTALPSASWAGPPSLPLGQPCGRPGSRLAEPMEAGAYGEGKSSLRARTMGMMGCLVAALIIGARPARSSPASRT